MTKPRVLMLAPFPTCNKTLSGGVTAAAHYLANALYESGNVELQAISLGTDHCVSEIPYKKLTISSGKHPLLSRFGVAVKTLRAVVQQFKPDLIHAHGMDAYGYVALKLSDNAIVTPHGLIEQEIGMQDTFIGNIRKAYINIALCNYVLHNVRHVASISPFLTRYFSENSKAIIYEVANVVPDKFFQIKRNVEPGLFLYIGRIRRLKGLTTAIKAFALNRNIPFTCIMAGEVEDRRYYESIQALLVREQVSDRFKFVGVQSETNILGLMSRAQALILPSLREVAPMVITQAFAARLPVIATDVGGVPELICGEERGTLFAPRDYRQLSKHIMGVLSGEVSYCRRAVRAREYALNQLSSDVVVKRTLSIYERVLNSANV